MGSRFRLVDLMCTDQAPRRSSTVASHRDRSGATVSRAASPGDLIAMSKKYVVSSTLDQVDWNAERFPTPASPRSVAGDSAAHGQSGRHANPVAGSEVSTAAGVERKDRILPYGE